VVGEAHCISLLVVAEEQMLEPIDIVPALQRGWAWWCAGAALNVGNMIAPFLSKLSNSEYQIDIAFKS
jgi:hypothetical protein